MALATVNMNSTKNKPKYDHFDELPSALPFLFAEAVWMVLSSDQSDAFVDILGIVFGSEFGPDLRNLAKKFRYSIKWTA